MPARLTIAYASADHAQQWIYVNNETTTFNTYFPDYGDGNAFIRQANFAKYSYKQILIPMSRLRAGSNTITLVMPSNSAWVSHLMYDYLSLEVPGISVLPVALVSFSAKAVGKKAQLDWETASEKNNRYFEVERRGADGVFSAIGRVPAAANPDNRGFYTFTDPAPLDNNNYYRLKQVDNDGKYTYSAIRQVKIEPAALITVYPDPVTHTLFIYSASTENIRKISVADALGKTVIRKANIGARQYELNMSGLAKGIYFVTIRDGSMEVVKRITKN